MSDGSREQHEDDGGTGSRRQVQLLCVLDTESGEDRSKRVGCAPPQRLCGAASTPNEQLKSLSRWDPLSLGKPAAS